MALQRINTDDLDPIRLSPDQEETLIDVLIEHGIEGREYKGNFDENHDNWWSLYLADPQEANPDWPWPGANKFCAPMVQVAVDMMVSLFYDAMLTTRPQVVGDQSNPEVAEQLDRFNFKYLWEKVISLPLFGNDFCFETNLDGTSVTKIRWIRDKTIIRKLQEVREDQTRQVQDELLAGIKISTEQAVDTVTRMTEELRVKEEQRAGVEIVDFGRIYVAPGTKCGTTPGGSMQYPDCPWFFEEQYWDASRMRQAYMEGFDVPLRKEDQEEAFVEVEETAREKAQKEIEDLPSGGRRGARVEIHFMRLALPGTAIYSDGEEEREIENEFDNGIEEEVVIWYMPDIKKIIRVEPLTRIRPDGKRPYVDNRFSRMGSFFYGQGIPAKLEQVLRLYNSATRQMIDFGTLQNKPWMIFEPTTTGLFPSIQQIRPGAMIPVNSASGFQIPRLQGNHSFFQVVEQIATMWSERITSITDTTIGRNPELPNSPRTFRGQAQMLQQNNIAFSHRVALFAVAFQEIFRHVHAVYQAFAPDEIEFEYFSQEGDFLNRERISREAFRADVEFKFQLNPNKVFEQERAQQLFGLMQNLPWIIQDPGAMRGVARDVYASFDSLEKFDRIWPRDKLVIHNSQYLSQLMQSGVSPAVIQTQPDLAQLAQLMMQEQQQQQQQQQGMQQPPGGGQQF